MLTANDIRQKYLDFYKSKGHQVIPSAPLVPENDPTTLFTGSGMQPMVPYLLGQEHPLGTKLVDSQKCFRSQDIEEVGDNRHDTFFEMLGNWSLGDYFKTEQLTWLYHFLTEELGLSKNRLWVTVFAGDDIIPKDEEAIAIWKNLGIPGDHILPYNETKNWWSRAGVKANMPIGEPGGPDSEIFYEFTDVVHDPKFGPHCHPNCDCGRFMEIGNSVFMTYKKTDQGFVPLEKKNIDFGGGLERIAAAVNNDPDIFKTSLFVPIIQSIEKVTDKNYVDYPIEMRIIADHVKASVFLIKDGVRPSNKGQGYFLRRLLRRSAIKMFKLCGKSEFFDLYKDVLNIYSGIYFDLTIDTILIAQVVEEEIIKFKKTMLSGLRELQKFKTSFDPTKQSFGPSPEDFAKKAFDLYQSYGLPIDSFVDDVRLNWYTSSFEFPGGWEAFYKEFDAQLKKHQDLSRTASAGMFKGGLQDQSEVTTKYHTATHLLHKALRQVLGDHVGQKGSNITADRLRFDFSHSEKLTPDQLQKVEAIVNQKITENLPVTREEMSKTQALSEGALAFFVEKYPDTVSVYTIGSKPDWFSKELCGGPHVNSTGQIGKIKIEKEESAGAGVRRIYAKLSS